MYLLLTTTGPEKHVNISFSGKHLYARQADHTLTRDTPSNLYSGRVVCDLLERRDIDSRRLYLCGGRTCDCHLELFIRCDAQDTSWTEVIATICRGGLRGVVCIIYLCDLCWLSQTEPIPVQ